MEQQILDEIRMLRIAVSRLIGTSDYSTKKQFSKKALDIAALQFQKLSIERKEWVDNYDISKYIKNAPYDAGKFIIKEFSFNNYFVRGKKYFFNKKDLIDLAKELKSRNVDLKRYMEFVNDQVKFNKYTETAFLNTKGKKNPAFKLSSNVKNVNTSRAKPPSADLVRKDIQQLEEEFKEHNLSDYIDIYRDHFAMMKYIYHFEKYLEPGLKKRCVKWCKDFNYANNALQEVTKSY